MAAFKCKMCGGDLEITPDMTVCECEYCGTKQTVPTADNEKKMTLFSRANRLLRACEFDKAAGVFESIVAEFPEEAEAYWGLVLCKYGIEYVDDPATGKKIPTCHRSGFDSVMDDTNFEQACENADAIARRVYRDEAKAIEELRKAIIEVSGKEEPYDIFICYKETAEDGQRTLDSVLAQDVYDALTEKGYRVFFSRITLEDKLGQEYEPYIFAALHSAKIMLAFGTDYDYYNAVWVKNEWSRYLQLIAKGEKKTLIPCYKGIDAYDMPKEFAKLQAQDMGKVGAIQDLLRGIEKIIGGKTQEPVKETVTVQQSGGANVASLLQRAYMFLEDGEWQSADEYCEKVLDIEPENARAYLGKLLAAKKLTEAAKLAQLNDDFTADKNWQKAKKFADNTFAEELKGIVQQKTDRLEAERIAAEKAAEERRIAEEKAAEERRIAEAKAAEERRIAEAKAAEKRRIAEENAAEKFKRTKELFRDPKCPVPIAAGRRHTVGLCADGTVVACGSNEQGQCDVAGWHNIVAISAGIHHTVGLCADGTAVACGSNLNVGDWRNIVAIATGSDHTVGLRAGGTVVACGSNGQGQCDVDGWHNIVAISAGIHHTVGLCADGTVVACGSILYGQCNVGDWRNIVAIATGDYHTVGLCADGTVVTCGLYGKHNAYDWRNIVAIAAGSDHTVGLCADGSVVACGLNNNYQCDVDSWHNMVAIAAGGNHTVGLCADGSVVACGLNNNGQCNVDDWQLFQSEAELEAVIEQCRVAAEKARQKKITALNTEKSALQTELANLKGLFTGKRRNEIETRLAEIDAELKKLEG